MTKKCLFFSFAINLYSASKSEMFTLRNEYTLRNLSVLDVLAGPVCSLMTTALVFSVEDE